jgi:hypothetical protein
LSAVFSDSSARDCWASLLPEPTPVPEWGRIKSDRFNLAGRQTHFYRLVGPAGLKLKRKLEEWDKRNTDGAEIGVMRLLATTTGMVYSFIR